MHVRSAITWVAGCVLPHRVNLQVLREEDPIEAACRAKVRETSCAIVGTKACLAAGGACDRCARNMNFFDDSARPISGRPHVGQSRSPRGASPLMARARRSAMGAEPVSWLQLAHRGGRCAHGVRHTWHFVNWWASQDRKVWPSPRHDVCVCMLAQHQCQYLSSFALPHRGFACVCVCMCAHV